MSGRAARDHALITLDARRLGDLPRQLTGTAHQAAPRDPRDRALAEQIAIGVVKNLFPLEILIEHFAARHRRNIDPLVFKILLVAMYQLRYLDRIPPRAAVDEAVEQAKRYDRKRAAGFVNAVLRKASARAWPPIPDESDPAKYAHDVLSHPYDLFARLQNLLGTQAALALCRRNNAEPPTILRLAPGKSAGDAALFLASQQAADAKEAAQPDQPPLIPHALPGFVILPSPRRIALAALADAGIGQVQDPTSALPVTALNARPGERILDRCCGLGTKTLELARAVQVPAAQSAGESIRQNAGAGATGGMVLAMDRSESRCQTLLRILRRRGIGNVCVRVAAQVEKLAADDPQLFDAILVDAPCSNSGVLARRPEARYAQSSRQILSLQHLQDEILEDTLPRLRPGGRLVYATCSIWRQENQERIALLLKAHPDLQLVREQATIPSSPSDSPAQWHDGGYWALLKRSDRTSQSR